MSSLLARYAPTILGASPSEIDRDPTLGGSLTMDRHGDLAVNYAPFEHIAPKARVVIVGITPGVQQAANALNETRRQMLAGSEYGLALAASKAFASFSGSMRSNLVALLDHIGLAHWLGTASSDALWAERNDDVHFTSALRYPVFVCGKNYSGSPSMLETPFLRKYLVECLTEEARALPGAVWVPLGPRVSEALDWFVGRGVLSDDKVLHGLPHPSGANAERIAYFLGRKPRERLSLKTNADLLDRARERLSAKVHALA